MEIFSPKKLKERRQELNLTQTRLAQLAKLSRIHLANIERGKGIPGASILARLANVLQVKVDYFFIDDKANYCS